MTSGLNSNDDDDVLTTPEVISVTGSKVLELNYGENPWQIPAGLWKVVSDDTLAIDRFQIVSGMPPSYNNLVDIDRTLQTATHIAAGFDINFGVTPKIAVAVKHGNSCGAAVGDDATSVLEKMLIGDTRAIFGGLIMTNFEIDVVLAEVILTYKSGGSRRLLDVLVAPSFSEGSVDLLRRRGDRCRFLVNPALALLDRNSLDRSLRRRQVRGGYLLQPNYTFVLDLSSSEVGKQGNVDDLDVRDLVLAWAIGSTSNSNTVTLVRDGHLIGNGVGQPDRVGCCELAIKRATDAGHNIKGAIAYSDSFFPFPDGPEAFANVGVRAIVTSSGSVRDDETRKICEDRGVALIMIPDKLGRGFFGH